MMSTRQIKLGLCPIGKFVFSHENACRQKAELVKQLKAWDVFFVDIEAVLPDGMVRDQSHVDPVVEHFKRENIDALFLPHCNFGTEGATGMIAARLGVPVLLWGPRDEAPLADGTRLRDSLCGMLAGSKVLHKLGVPFTYIENCRIDDPPFREGLDTFLRAVNVADVFRRGVRIGLVGGRIDFFWTTIVNESELLEKFKVEILPLDMVEFIRHAKSRVRENRGGYQKQAAEMRNEWTIEGFSDDEPLMNILAVRDQMLALAHDHRLEGFAVQDFMALVDEMGTYCFAANSLAAEHVAIGCESDIHGAISDILVRRAAMDGRAGFLADITVRHPENDNGVLLWHAGAPLSMRDLAGEKPRLGHHWILPSELSGMTHFKLKEGPITVARFDGDRGQYKIAIGEGKTIPGPSTQNNYVWLEVTDWPRWERQLMEGPFIHHAAMVYGHYGRAMREAVKYIPNLSTVILGQQDNQ